MEKTDTQLITDYLNGEEHTLELLIKRHLKSVYNFVRRFTGNKQDSEDITQEVFLKVWKNIKKYRAGESFKTWLFAIAKNTSIDWLRKKKSLVFSEFEGEDGENALLNTLTDPAPLPFEHIVRMQDKKLLDTALEKLSPMYRAVMLLRYHHHCTFEEIGIILGKPLHTVKSQHRRAIAIMRKLLLEHAPKKDIHP